MALVFRDGDYVPDGSGGFRTVSGSAEVLERVLWKLSVRRGSFPLLPELGSDLYLLGRAPEKGREGLAEQYVRQALSDEPLTITDVKLTALADGKGKLRVYLLYKGEALTAVMEVGGLT